MKVTVRSYEKDPSLLDEQKGLVDSTMSKDTQEFLVDFSVVGTLLSKHENPIVFLTHANAKSCSSSFKDFLSRTNQVLMDLFLPIGYPQSVDSSYLPYQLYDGLQGLCSYWRGVVATQAVLEAAGVGDAEATAASAALQWALRDGTGMVGGLVFSYVASNYFDTHVKEFRLFADVINDVALTLDMVAPYVSPAHRLYVLSLSTIGKTLCGMSAGATKGRITQHFATRGNMADLTAKESTQETLVSLLGMIGGVVVARLLEHQPLFVTWTLFGLLTLIHVWANYKAVKLLRLATLNSQRTKELLQPLLRVLDRKGSVGDIQGAIATLASPGEIDESLYSSTWDLLFPTIHLPSKLNPKHFEFAELFSDCRYLIGRDPTNETQIFVHLRVGASPKDQLRAFLHALLLELKLQSKAVTLDFDLISSTLSDVQKVYNMESQKSSDNEEDCSDVLWKELAAKGWDLESRLYLGFGSRRIDWSISEKSDMKKFK